MEKLIATIHKGKPFFDQLARNRYLKAVRLAPAYDILSTIVYDTHSREMAFSIGGELEWNRISREHFEAACAETGLNRRIFMNRFDALCSKFEQALEQAAAILTEEGFTGAGDLAARIMKQRQETGLEKGN